MSTRNRSKRSSNQPRTTPKQPSTADEITRAQHRLDRAAEVFRAAQAERRQVVRKAWSNGATAVELANLLQVSRQKVYEIIGGVPRSKTGPIT